jgi:hypothetical protein
MISSLMSLAVLSAGLLTIIMNVTSIIINTITLPALHLRRWCLALSRPSPISTDVKSGVISVYWSTLR